MSTAGGSATSFRARVMCCSSSPDRLSTPTWRSGKRLTFRLGDKSIVWTRGCSVKRPDSRFTARDCCRAGRRPSVEGAPAGNPGAHDGDAISIIVLHDVYGLLHEAKIGRAPQRTIACAPNPAAIAVRKSVGVPQVSVYSGMTYASIAPAAAMPDRRMSRRCAATISLAGFVEGLIQCQALPTASSIVAKTVLVRERFRSCIATGSSSMTSACCGSAIRARPGCSSASSPRRLATASSRRVHSSPVRSALRPLGAASEGSRAAKGHGPPRS